MKLLSFNEMPKKVSATASGVYVLDTMPRPRWNVDPHKQPISRYARQSIDMNELSKLLQILNPRKAACPYRDPCRFIQTVAKELAPSLTVLFQRSLLTCEIPEIWMHALVQPVFKKGDRSQAANYRPIFLTSVCCKLLEHIVRLEFTARLDRNNITDAQHGFRKRR